MKRTLKILPGRASSGKDIKRRLQNKTLQGEVFGDDQYTLDAEMVAFTKMNKVEQINSARESARNIAKIEQDLQNANDRKRAKQEEERINRLADEKFKKLREENAANQQSTS